MKRIVGVFLFLVVLTLPTMAVSPRVTKVANQAMLFAAEQYSFMAGELKDKAGRLPKSTDKDGNLTTSDAKWWCSGFFPGTLWYLFEYKQDLALRHEAVYYSERVAGEQYTTDNHDVGFMIYCSYGNAQRLEPSEAYKKIILTTARSLSTRFKQKTGLIRSWDWGKWQYPVIIDNMMNLELLFNATKLSGDSSFYKIAIAHADNTMKNHFREDASCYHVVSYDSITGVAQSKGTFQGFSDSSSWARGQAWALYGYTMVYRETKDLRYLQHAQKIANFLLKHPRMPKDMIPYWDFDAPNIPEAKRDASAAAVICSALIELSTFVNKKDAKMYMKAVDKQIVTLSSPSYRANLGENGGFILKHSVGSFPHKSEVDVPLTYADYYYIEALQRYLKLGEKKK